MMKCSRKLLQKLQEEKQFYNNVAVIFFSFLVFPGRYQSCDLTCFRYYRCGINKSMVTYRGLLET